jgi:hypothetical protein
MSTPSTGESSANAEPTSTSPGAAFSYVMSTALDFAAAAVSQKADDWTDRLHAVAARASGGGSSGLEDLADEGLDQVAAGGGATRQAGAKGVQAGLQGKNPVWAAIRGAWAGGSAKVKAAIVTAVVAMVLLLVLSPVLLLVFLLSVLIIVAVAKARSATH